MGLTPCMWRMRYGLWLLLRQQMAIAHNSCCFFVGRSTSFSNRLISFQDFLTPAIVKNVLFSVHVQILTTPHRQYL